MRIITVLIVFWMTAGYAVAADTWSPIIGIPEPPFGITTSHTMYADCGTYKYDYGLGNKCYRIGPDGPYTHYIDPDHPSSTDTDNPYGTVAVPRISLPSDFTSLPEGSVVEIHGGIYDGINIFHSDGTSTHPIFIRGISGDKPTFTATVTYNNIFQFRGNYYVLENVKIDLADRKINAIRMGLTDGAVSYVAVRDCEIYNSQENVTGGLPVVRLIHEHYNSNKLSYLIFHNNTFHNLGENRTELETGDVTAISIDQNVEHVWIVNNTFYKIGGDGVQIATDSPDANAIIPNHIYIGKNIFSDCFENAVDLKMCEDIIISQNTAHDFGPGYCTNCDPDAHPFRYGSGQGIPSDQRKYIWTIYNLVYNSGGPDGAYMSYVRESETFPDEIYYIGNVAYNIHNDAGDAVAFGSWNQEKIYWLNNTAYNCDENTKFYGDRVGNLGTEKVTVVNNIFGDLHSGSTANEGFLFGALQDSLDRAEISNNIFYNSRGEVAFKIGVYEPSGQRSWTTYSSYSDFYTAYPSFCTDSIKSNPYHVDAFNADFHLTSASPAINAGADQGAYATFQSRYGISIQVDHDNKPVPDGIALDIGAYEYEHLLIPALKNVRIVP